MRAIVRGRVVDTRSTMSLSGFHPRPRNVTWSHFVSHPGVCITDSSGVAFYQIGPDSEREWDLDILADAAREQQRARAAVQGFLPELVRELKRRARQGELERTRRAWSSLAQGRRGA